MDEIIPMEKEINKLVAKYTRILHPEDRGKATSNLEKELEEMCHELVSTIIKKMFN